ncbi:FCD domain-containing protein [Burkholderia cenocepacia]|uniref:FCD domain-containing protein n=1 Tax=Burkholderia cenocepacia TaxID=95486 RepID=UPI0020122D26|nr:FCD domain-containing protein [Burkholderia cenocepacia]
MRCAASEACNQRFHEALISAAATPWAHLILHMLSLRSKRYRRVRIGLGDSERDMHAKHTCLFEVAMRRADARAALAIEDHIGPMLAMCAMRRRTHCEFGATTRPCQYGYAYTAASCSKPANGHRLRASCLDLATQPDRYHLDRGISGLRAARALDRAPRSGGYLIQMSAEVPRCQ